MSNKIRNILVVITTLMGIILIVGGIITDKNGAVVVGLIVSAVAIQQWNTGRKKSNQGNQ